MHRLTCPDCGTTTCGTLPEGVPTGRFGPYLQAVLATLAGAYRLSKRQIQQLAGDLFGLSISTGMISKLERQSAAALEAPYNELATAVHTAEVIHADETSWREDRGKAWLWAAVTALFTVFTIARNRNAQVAQAVLGTQDGPIAVTDRCELLRLDRRGEPTGLLEPSPPRFPGDDRPGRRRRTDREEAVATVGSAVPMVASPRGREGGLGAIPRGDGPAEARGQGGPGGRSALRLRRGRAGPAPRSCGWRRACGPSRGCEGVPPTNNAAERAERHAVIWRRISGGTDSAQGSRFVERMLTVVATCRQQGRNVLDYLTSCFEAARSGQAIPSLLPATPPKIKVA